jgi:hypothetical protein
VLRRQNVILPPETAPEKCTPVLSDGGVDVRDAVAAHAAGNVGAERRAGVRDVTSRAAVENLMTSKREHDDVVEGIYLRTPPEGR